MSVLGFKLVEAHDFVARWIIFSKVPNLGLILLGEMRLVSLKVEEVLRGDFIDTILNFMFLNYREMHMTSSEAWSRFELVGKCFGFFNNMPRVTKDAIVGKFKCALVFGALGYRYFGPHP